MAWTWLPTKYFHCRHQHWHVYCRDVIGNEPEAIHTPTPILIHIFRNRTLFTIFSFKLIFLTENEKRVSSGMNAKGKIFLGWRKVSFVCQSLSTKFYTNLLYFVILLFLFVRVKVHIWIFLHWTVLIIIKSWKREKKMKLVYILCTATLSAYICIFGVQICL